MLKCVAIDPGHGGKDPGCVFGEHKESDIAWDIAGICKLLIESHGIECVLTRNYNDDPSFKTRDSRAVDRGATLVVSIHVNASESPNSHGMRCYYWPGNVETRAICSAILSAAPEELIRLGEIPRPTNKDTDPRARNVLGSYTYPAVLVETGFLTNYNDRNALLDDGMQHRIAMAICAGILSVTSKP